MTATTYTPPRADFPVTRWPIAGNRRYDGAWGFEVDGTTFLALGSRRASGGYYWSLYLADFTQEGDLIGDNNGKVATIRITGEDASGPVAPYWLGWHAHTTWLHQLIERGEA